MSYGRGGQKGSFVRGQGEKYVGQFIEVHKTENACLLKREGDDDDMAEWVPFSQIDKVLRKPGTNVVEVTMSAWIAKKKDFI